MVGNKPNFNDFDVIRCFLAASRNISRQRLVRELGLGEGTVRSLLGILKSKGIISSTRKGHSLTRKGEALAGRINCSLEIRKIKTKIYKNTRQAAVLVRTKRQVKISVGLRDIAIKNGADAALILSFDKKLYAPGMEINFPELERIFEFEKNNVLVVSFAKTQRDAENSALAVAGKIVDLRI